MKVSVVPYTEVDGVRTFSDSGIKRLFLRTVEDDLATVVFYEGTVRTEEQFLAVMKYGECLFYVIYIDSDVIGYAWLNRFENRTARYHFCAFKDYWGRLDDVAPEIMSTLFKLKDSKNKPLFDLFTGYIPIWNKPAVKFTLKHGGRSAGEIPNAIYNAETKQSEPAIFIYYTRGDV